MYFSQNFPKISLIDFFKEYENDSFGFSQSTLKGRSDMRKKVEEYLDEEGLTYIGIKDILPLQSPHLCYNDAYSRK